MQHLQFKLLMKQLEASELLPRCHHVVVSLSPRDQYVYITFSLSCPYVVTQSIFKTDFGQISKCPLHSFSDFTTERMKLADFRVKILRPSDRTLNGGSVLPSRIKSFHLCVYTLSLQKEDESRVLSRGDSYNFQEENRYTF
ncbi:hypothetical protein GQR58_018655 [Nymphon striatum]|nr:hypothetical protein GQR58_018655 [Nymphon striatum]